MKHTALLFDEEHHRWLKFERPSQIFQTKKSEEVLPLLQMIEKEVEKTSSQAVGFLSYEAAPAFDKALRVKPSEDFPLLWFALYPSSELLDELPFPSTQFPAIEWEPSVDKEGYERAIDTVKKEISLGNTYQVNYTFRLTASLEVENPLDLFLDLARRQPTRYAAFIDTGSYAICSLSPELFFELDGTTITAKPMKGTLPRGRTWEEDEEQAKKLAQSEKNRAENVMIVDMVRNDLTRISLPASVQTTELFAVERYPTLWQMISTVQSQTEAPISSILQALFPSASITGAPKVSTMRIIADLETTPRKIYTGAIGFIAPQRRARFNVAIRTLLIDQLHKKAELGIGGGIVWDSQTDNEYEESLLKASFLLQDLPSFQLLETILWDPTKEEFRFLDGHLNRMKRSALYFDRSFSEEAARNLLKEKRETFDNSFKKIRLLLDESGKLTCEVEELDPDFRFFEGIEEMLGVSQQLPTPKTESYPPLARIAQFSHSSLSRSACFTAQTVHSEEPFLFHKTTYRDIYDNARRIAQNYHYCDDAILINQRGEVTELTTANIVILKEGKLFTPSLQSGLLPGIFRQYLLDEGVIQEKIITKQELEEADAIFAINSLRGWRPIRFVPV